MGSETGNLLSVLVLLVRRLHVLLLLLLRMLLLASLLMSLVEPELHTVRIECLHGKQVVVRKLIEGDIPEGADAAIESVERQRSIERRVDVLL